MLQKRPGLQCAAPGQRHSLCPAVFHHRGATRFCGRGVGQGHRARARSAGQETMIAVERISKSFGSLKVLSRVSLDVSAGEVVVLCGPSGSGKSTLLRCINRLETVEEGRIFVNGIDVTAKR